MLPTAFSLLPLAALPLAPLPPQGLDPVVRTTAEGPFRLELVHLTGTSRVEAADLGQAVLVARALEQATGAEVLLEPGCLRLRTALTAADLEPALASLRLALARPPEADGSLASGLLDDDPALARALEAVLDRGEPAAIAAGADGTGMASAAAALLGAGPLVVLEGPAPEERLRALALELTGTGGPAAGTPAPPPAREGTTIHFAPRPARALATLRGSVRLAEPGAEARARLRGLLRGLSATEGVSYRLEEGSGGPLLCAEARVEPRRLRPTAGRMLQVLAAPPLDVEGSPAPPDFGALSAAARDALLAGRPDEAGRLLAAPGVRLIVLGPPESRAALQGLGELRTLELPAPLRPPLPARALTLLEAVGGREAWAGLRALHLEIRIEAGPQVLETEQWVALGEPRQRVEIRIGGDEWVQVLDGDRGWERRGGELRELTPAEVEARIQQKRRGLWELLHTLALGGRLEAREGSGEDSLILEGEAGLALELVLDELGRPDRLRYRSELGQPRLFEYGEWRQHAGLVHAARIEEKNSNSSWTVQRFEVLPELDRSLLEPR